MKASKILGFIAMLLSAGHAFADFGTPNQEQELRFQQIFEKYAKEPVDEEKWESMLGARSSESYKIQTGDTLWDLSETMFGDGAYWPKLWSENRSIENPHQIEPRKQVRFIAGTAAQAPTVRIEESEATKPYYVNETHEHLTKEEIASGSIIEDADVIGRRPEIPPPNRKQPAVLRNLPPSFKFQINSKHLSDFDSSGIDIGEVKAFKVPASVTLNSFVSTELPRKLGFVKEIEVQEATASILQSVFLELGRKVNIGDHLNVVVIKHDIVDEGTVIGHVIEVGGSVEITEIVNEENGIYKAIVVDCVMPIQLNASITDEPLPKASFSFVGPRKNIQGKVIGGEYNEDRKLFGTASVVYLNIGAESGVQDGDLLAVRSIRKSRREDTDLDDVGRPIGVVKIAKVSQRASTAIVINTIDEIHPGDVTGGEFPLEKNYTIGSRNATVDLSNETESEKNETYTEEFDKAATPPTDLEIDQ